MKIHTHAVTYTCIHVQLLCLHMDPKVIKWKKGLDFQIARHDSFSKKKKKIARDDSQNIYKSMWSFMHVYSNCADYKKFKLSLGFMCLDYNFIVI